MEDDNLMSDVVNGKKSEASLINSDDKLWKEYEIYIDIFKYYLDLLLKFNIFYYASTGAILSFFFTQTEKRFVEYSLIFPILVSTAFGILFLYGASQFETIQKNISEVRDQLKLNTRREFDVFIVLLNASALFMIGIAVVIFVLFLLTIFTGKK